MKPSKLLFEVGVMVAGLLLVLITLSGDTQKYGIIISVSATLFFIISNLIKDDEQQ
jgi:hypothetical protein|tara:strand:- start:281 stop:448 length:168 start_codon:yes stop_codon:yes gene_type:complete